MKNKYLILILTCIFYLGANSQNNVTFQVDMNTVDPTTFTTPEVNGTFNGWCGNCAAMSDLDGDNIWDVTIDLANGTYEFKYSADNWTIQESLFSGDSCTNGNTQYTNRMLTVSGDTTLPVVCWSSCSSCNSGPSSYNVTFEVDMRGVTDPHNTPEVNGDFNSWCGNCWQMTDTDGDSIWQFTTSFSEDTIEWKYSADNWNIQEELDSNLSCITINYDPSAPNGWGFVNRLAVINSDTTFSSAWESCEGLGGGTGNPLSQIDLPITWDDTTVDYTVTDFGGNSSSLSVDPLDPTNNVIMSDKTAGAQTWAGTTLSTPSGLLSSIPFVSGSTTISAHVYSPNAGTVVRLKAEDHTDPTKSVETEATTTVANGWNTLVFDFANEAPGTAMIDFTYNYDMLSIFYDFGNNGVGDVYYLDSVAFGGLVGGTAGCTDPLASNYNPLATMDDGSCLYSTTFNVDMNCEPAGSFGFVHLESPYFGWCGGCVPMSDPDGDGVHSVTVDIPLGNFEYKYAVDNFSSDENLIDDMLAGGTCAPITDYSSYANRELLVTAGVSTNDTYGSCDPCITPPPVTTSYTINSGSYYYNPNYLVINVGDTVTWMNDGGYHDVNGNINSQTGVSFGNPVSFYLPPVSGPAVIGSYIFTVAGLYDYDCSIGNHAANGMTGTILVNSLPLSQIDLPITWDDTTVDYTVTDFGGNSSSLSVDPLDPTNNVIMSDKTAGAQTWAGTTLSTPSGLLSSIPFVSGSTTISAHVYSPNAGTVVRLKAEDHTDPTKSVETEATTTVANGWNTLVFDFANEAPGTAMIDFTYNYDMLSIFYDFGNNGVGDVYYLDSVAFGGLVGGTAGCTDPLASNYNPLATMDDGSCTYGNPLSQIDLPITWDDTTVDYTVTDFGGNSSSLSVDPLDPTNHVIMSDKTAGAQTWAGTTLSTPSGLLSSIPFVSGSTTISAHVYSPNAGTVVRLKAEDHTDPTKSVETEATTTVANGWNTLVFDFANEAPGTAMIDFSYNYDMLSIFYDFGNNGVGDVYYLDSVAFGGLVGGTAGCTDPLASNYNPLATMDDGSCTYGNPLSQIDLPITWDDTTVDYTVTDFGGNSSSLSVDPLDPTNHVIMSDKTAGAQTWAGTTLSTPSGLLSSIPFVSGSTTISAHVYSPNAGTVVRLKAEDHTDPTKSVETEATTTVAGGWNTLVFDFANEAPGTAMIDFSYNYDMLSIFYDFGNNGVGDVYYLDSVAFGGLVGGTAGCTDPLASNYNPLATMDDGTCNYTLQPMVDLFFSEYAEGSSYNKYFEIYNPTLDTIDLSQYAYPNVSNAPSTPGVYEYWNEFDLGAVILPNDVYVVAHPSSDSTILAQADETFTYLSNGDDGFGLVFGDQTSYQVIDWLGDWNGDPGSGWEVAGVPNATKDHTLVRKCDVTSGDTSWTNAAGTDSLNSQWLVYPQNTWTYLGSHVSPCAYIYGCTDPLAFNYDSLATFDDGSCIPFVYGCTDPNAINFFPGANIDDGSCIYAGCTDPLANNYDPIATIDDGSCTYMNCTDPSPTGLSNNWVTDTKAEITWDNMNDSACMVFKYFVRYREVGTLTWTTKSAGVGNGLCNFGLNTTTKTLQNLTSGTTYEYKMKAFYCGGTESNYSAPSQFTTAADCPPMTNLTATTFNGNQSKVRFDWDSTGAYVFARVALRVDTVGANWQTAGGFGVYYPTLTVNKFGLQSGESYRAQGRTFCDSNITSYRSWWTAPIFWTQPGTIRMSGGTTINNLDVYPNPTNDIFNVSFVSEEIQTLQLRVLNIVGEVVYTENLEQFVGEYTKQISIGNNARGVYFLEITDNQGTINKKIIVQ